MKRLIYIFLSIIAILAIGVISLDVQLRRWQIRMTVREWLARTKAVMDVYTCKQPHFLGEPITIE